MLARRLAANPRLARFGAEVAQREAALAREKAAVVPDVTLRAGPRQINESKDVTAVVGFSLPLPLWNRNRVIGAVQVDSPIHIGRFTEEDLDLITALANFAAVAVERAQLSEKIEQERKIRSKMERYHSPAVIDEIVKGVVAADETDIRTADVSPLRRHLRVHDVSETKNRRKWRSFCRTSSRPPWTRSSRTAARSTNSSATR